MQNTKFFRRQPLFSIAVAAALAMTVMVTFGTLIDAVAGTQAFL
jgi:hypothetical protein